VAQHRDEHRRHAAGDRRSFGLEQLKMQRGVESGQVDESGAGGQRAQHAHAAAGGVEQR
jgi:hypothetical protein